MPGNSILVIDSDTASRTFLCQKLIDADFQVRSASSGTTAIHSMLEDPPALVIVDSALVEEDPFSSAWDAFGILNWMKHMLPDRRIPLILHAAQVTDTLQERAQSTGIFAVVQKDQSTNLTTVVQLAFSALQADDGADPQ
jgi:CheY-like chemotaxis protein